MRTVEEIQEADLAESDEQPTKRQKIQAEPPVQLTVSLPPSAISLECSKCGHKSKTKQSAGVRDVKKQKLSKMQKTSRKNERTNPTTQKKDLEQGKPPTWMSNLPLCLQLQRCPV